MKRIFGFIGALLIAGSLWAQEDAPENWFTKDPVQDKIQGVSADIAYETIVKGKPSKTVIVAVIDSGVDIEHEDLKGKIWVNEDEIAGNGIDDDGNGYIDDVNGWNFIGGADGNIAKDTYELTREYVRLKPKYEGVDKPKKKDKEEYEYWLAVQASFIETYEGANEKYQYYNNFYNNITRYNTLLKAYLDVEKLNTAMVDSIKTDDEVLNEAQSMIGMILSRVGDDADLDEVAEQLEGAVEYFGDQVNYAYNVDFNPRSIVGDNYADKNQSGYGNNDVRGPDASHGTHVSGIIGANRNNDIGIQGIADNVVIMPVRAVPDGDERDKDVANAIHYAVDNGAQIINMSFGKGYSPDKKIVDEAIQYAESKNVLLIHAAGNSGLNLDESKNYPTPKLDNGKRASSWLEIGASSYGDDANFVGSFSNYGKTSVDLFAPGVSVYSTTPDNTYASYNGTSMAAPSTAGVAALVLSYYPDLTAKQLKEVLEKSTRKFDGLEVTVPGGKELVEFSDLSISGGLVNAVEALKLAEEMTGSTKAE